MSRSSRATAHAPRIVVELKVEFPRENSLELVQAVVAAAADEEGGGLQATDDDSGDVVNGRVANLQNKTANELQILNQTSAGNWVITMATLSSSPQS